MNKLLFLIFQTEKWIEVEAQDTNSKIYTKLAFSIMKAVTENKTKTPAKYNNYIDTSKSYEASPRLNHLTTKNSSISTQPLLTQPDELDIEPLNSYRKRSSTNVVNVNIKLPPTGSVRYY